MLNYKVLNKFCKYRLQNCEVSRTQNMIIISKINIQLYIEIIILILYCTIICYVSIFYVFVKKIFLISLQIPWNFNENLEDLNYPYGINLLTSRQPDIQNKVAAILCFSKIFLEIK